MIRAIHFSDAYAFKRIGYDGGIHVTPSQLQPGNIVLTVNCPCGCDRTQDFTIKKTGWNGRTDAPTLEHALTFGCGNRFGLVMGYWRPA